MGKYYSNMHKTGSFQAIFFLDNVLTINYYTYFKICGSLENV